MKKVIYYNKGLFTPIAVLLMLAVIPFITLGQTVKSQKPDKPQFQDQATKQAGEIENRLILDQFSRSSFAGANSGYWSHITTKNTGNLPFAGTGNYVFIDSQDRVFTYSNGLFVYNGSSWREIMAFGTPVTGVREIVEDDSGNIWIGTNNGLTQLNSSLEFVEEYHPGNSNLKKNGVNALMFSDNGSLWVGHSYNEETGGGVTIFNETVIDTINGHISDIYQRSNGDVWIADSPNPETGEFGGIHVYTEDDSLTYTENNSDLHHKEIDNFTEDSDGNVWMGLYSTPHHEKGGVIKFDGTDWTLYDQDDGLPHSGGWYTHAASDGNIYYSTGDSTMVYDGTWSLFSNGNSQFPLNGVHSITENASGDLYFGAAPGVDLTGNGIHIFDGTSWDLMSNYTDGGLFTNVIFGADVDTDGNVWVSGFHGAAMYDGTDWTYFNEHDGMGDTYAWKVEATSDGSVWFGVADTAGVTRYKDGTFTEYDQYGEYVEAIFEDSQGNVWFGAWDWRNIDNPGGILKYDSDSDNFTVYGDAEGVVGRHVISFGEGPDGSIYAATNQGLIKHDEVNDDWSIADIDGVTGDWVGEIASDQENNLWIDKAGVIRKWDGDSWTNYDESDGFMGGITHIEPAPDGSIWLVGPGIQVIKDGNLYDMTPSTEYGNTTSYVVTHDDQGQAWVGTYGNGIFKHEMSEGLTIESVEDYPNDQGGKVIVQPGGFMMNPIGGGEASGEGYWAVQMVDNGSWQTQKIEPEFSSNGNQMWVTVPTTMPSGEEVDEHMYDFRVAIFDTNDEPIAYSGTVSGFAVDNIAPAPVDGVDANRGETQVALTWNANTANDIQQYDIVSADDPEGQPLTSASQTSATLSDASYSGIQDLQVRARDQNQNVGDLSDPVRAVFPIDLTYDVEASWNLIGLPLDADQQQIDNLLSRIEEGNLYVFDGKYREAETLEPGKGYWAKFEGSSNYDVTGLPLVDNNIDLKEGWNLISGIGQSLNIGDISDPNGILVDGTLSGFNGSYTESSELNLGAGYWVRASEAGTITLSLDHEGSAKSKESTPVIAEAKKGLNQIIVSSGDHQRTLYFGNELPDEMNPLSFSLPPLPPGNAFDARFDEDMSHIEGNAFEINLQKQKGAKITVDLKLLQTSSHQQFVVQELKGGNVVAEHEMDGDKSVTLQNSDITGIRVATAGNELLNNDIPDKFSLDPSYPNPFNPSTTIRYRLPEQVAVHLEVFNMVGQKVNTLVQGEQQEAGIHKIRFNASSLSSGIYFVRLQAGTFRQIQKITLIK